MKNKYLKKSNTLVQKMIKRENKKIINHGGPDKCGNTSSEIGYIYEKRL